ncbi:MAG: glycosyltransferase [Gammaproteobacteria bacterium]
MRVLQVVHGLHRGGLENGVVNVLNGLSDDIEQSVVCLDSRGEMAERIQRPIPLVVLGRGRHDLKAVWRLARLIRDTRPDVIHCRNWNTWPDTVLAHRLAGRPGRLLWSFHGFMDGRGVAPWRRRVASRVLASLTDGLAAVCQDAANRYARVNGLASGRFRVLYNGVDTNRFRPAEDRAAAKRAVGWSTEHLTAVTVASLSPVKDHASLLRALALLDAGVRERLRVVFVGEGRERGALEGLVEDLGLASVVSMPGGSDRVPDLLAAADISILPSRLEGMSNAITESMAAGLPVVANGVGGNPELIVDGETGLLTTQGDDRSMALALARLIGDASERTAMGDAGRLRAESRFSMQAMMDRYAELYRELAT